MGTTTKTIDVRVPVRVAYNQWTQFEDFPKFMEGVNEVHQMDDKRLKWNATVGGKQQEWTAEITEQMPDKRIAWRATAGEENAGVVTFHHLDEDRTRVTLQMSYEPEGMTEKIGDMTGFMDRRLQKSLDQFKEFIESRGSETGAWRGEIDNHPNASSS
ncbi:MAG: SRPBCC family protein [Nitrolancea sp.]